MRFLTIIFSVCFWAARGAAQDAFVAKIDLTQCRNNSLHVRLQTPSIVSRKARFIIPTNIPGTISELQTGKLFSNIKAFNKNNQPLAVVAYSTNEYEISVDGELAYLEYDVHDSWHYENRSLILPQIGTDFVENEHFLLNFHAVVGYIQGYEEARFKIEITRPKSLNVISGLNFTSSGDIDRAEVSGYLTLIDNPALYTKEKEQTYSVGGTKFKIGCYSELSSVRAENIARVLKTVCESASAFCGGFQAKQYVFLFNYSFPENNPFKAEEAFGAVEHSQSSVYYFPINSSNYKFERDLLYTAAHELMHLFGPLQLETDVTSKINFRAKTQSSNLWIYEGFTEYLSLLMLYQQELITETEFINEVRNKINLANYSDNYSLETASRQCYLDGNGKMYKSFYTKGALLAMMLDLKLLKMSKGEMNLKSLLIDLKNVSRANYVMRDEFMVDELAKYSYPEIKDFLKSHAQDTVPQNYNEYFSAIGWKYEPQKVDTSNMYVNAVFRYAKTTKEYYMVNISFDQIGFNEGDVLKSINGKKVTKENLNELLDKFSSVNYKKQVKFVVKRGDKLLELTGPPLLVTLNQRNLITVEREVKQDKEGLRNFFSGNKELKTRSFKILN